MNAKLVICFLLIVPIFVSCSPKLETVSNDDELDRLYAWYGNDLFSALASLPETHEKIAHILGEESLVDTVLVGNNISDVEKTRILSGLTGFLTELNEADRKQLIKRIENWVHAYQAFGLAGHLTFVEGATAALYLAPSTTKWFDPLVRRRNWERGKISAIYVAAAMSSSQHYELRRDVLNQLSKSTELEQATFFAEFYGALVHDQQLRDWVFQE